LVTSSEFDDPALHASGKPPERGTVIEGAGAGEVITIVGGALAVPLKECTTSPVAENVSVSPGAHAFGVGLP